MDFFHSSEAPENALGNSQAACGPGTGSAVIVCHASAFIFGVLITASDIQYSATTSALIGLVASNIVLAWTARFVSSSNGELANTVRIDSNFWFILRFDYVAVTRLSPFVFNSVRR